MKILVTGSEGYIATYLIPKLKERFADAEIFRIDKKLKVDLSISVPILKGSTFDYVFHLAANSSVRDNNYESDMFSTHGLLELLEGFHGTFVYTSSSTVYGNTEIIPTPETSICKPISLYGASKLSSESLICAYASLSGFKAKILRIANVVGRKGPHGVIPDFISQLKQNGQIKMLGSGNQRKSFIHISDCVDAIMYSLDKGKDIDIFNVGSKDSIPVWKIASFLTNNFTAQGGKAWQGDVELMQLDISKLGFSPKYSSIEAVREAIQSLC